MQQREWKQSNIPPLWKNIKVGRRKNHEQMTKASERKILNWNMHLGGELLFILAENTEAMPVYLATYYTPRVFPVSSFQVEGKLL